MAQTYIKKSRVPAKANNLPNILDVYVWTGEKTKEFEEFVPKNYKIGVTPNKELSLPTHEGVKLIPPGQPIAKNKTSLAYIEASVLQSYYDTVQEG